MESEVRILMLEDLATDAELVERQLRKANITFRLKRVDTRDAFLSQLREFEPDLILADYGLPAFDGLSALALARERKFEIPFIIVSATLGEEKAIEALKSGATDYVLKDGLSRLGAAVRRALNEARERVDRRRAERSLEESLRFIQQIADSTPNILYVYDLVEQRITYVNRRIVSILGYTPEQVQQSESSIRALLHPDDLEPVTGHMKRLQTAKDGEVESAEFRVMDARGDWRWLSTQSTVLTRRADGLPGQVLAVAEDITDRKRVEDELRESEEFNRAVLGSLTAHVAVLDKNGNVIAVNEAWKRFAQEVGDASLSAGQVGSNYLEICREMASNGEAQEALSGIHAVLDGSQTRFTLEWQWHLLNKGRWFFMHVSPLLSKRGGAVVSHLDISEMKNLEEQLRQSQKMEGIGRLAGGIAHDFNNLLTAILGYSQLLLTRLDPDDPRRQDVEEISGAGDRAAALTSQLLAFSRKQVVQPRILDLNGVLAGMDKLLKRIMGEDIELAKALEQPLGVIKADPGQIEQIVMNLAVNARDAMPSGGRFIMETANLDLDEEYARDHINMGPGQYVMLALSDTGCGMDKETQSRVFEPFFTTKELGRGTGLGLSTVYGIVKQSGGSIGVYSEPDRGTTFKIYFPKVEETAEAAEPWASLSSFPGGSETVLLVEDEEAVRKLASQILQINGYRVLEASHSSEAILICDQHEGEIHLIMTDVVMPGMGGGQLVTRLAVRRPGAKVLYMSGYTDEAILHHGVLDEGAAFLQKPFTPGGLLRKVREALESGE